MDQIKKRLSGFTWHSVMMSIPFILGFLTDPQIKSLIEQYPKQLGFLLTIGLILAQITRFFNGVYQYNQELKKFQ